MFHCTGSLSRSCEILLILTEIVDSCVSTKFFDTYTREDKSEINTMGRLNNDMWLRAKSKLIVITTSSLDATGLIRGANYTLHSREPVE